MLQPLGSLTTCKFTNETKTEAYIKFTGITDQPQLLKNLETKGEYGKLFKVELKQVSKWFIYFYDFNNYNLQYF